MNRTALLVVALLGYTPTLAVGATIESILRAVPDRIRTYRAELGYGKFSNTNDELGKKWDYVRFLEELLRTVNREVTKGDALSEEQIRSIGDFATVTVILRDGYIRSTFRGASGFEMREVNEWIGRFEDVLERFVPAIGRKLSLYDPMLPDWDTDQAEAWRREFIRATGRDSEDLGGITAPDGSD